MVSFPAISGLDLLVSDQILIQFPSDLSVSDDSICTITSITTNCTISNNTVLISNFVQFGLSLYQVNVSQVTNPPSTKPVTGFIVQMTDS